uniref:Ribosomal protein L14 n=1 Tax=Hepatozoon canis TaxID=110120 RepID=A0A3S8TEQ5_9APIC|nr:ribosomal protein L14 [Hepatozoon canis]
MILINTLIDVIDNSGVSKLLCLGNLSRKTNIIKLNDVIIGVVKKIKKNSNIRNSSIVRGLVVTSKKLYETGGGCYISFFKNSAIILTKKNIPIGTRVLDSFYYKKIYYKLIKIRSINIK